MNRLLLSFIFGFLLIQVNAQFSMTTHADEPIENNQTFSFNTTEEAEAKLGYIVHNDSSELILMKAEVAELTGTDGTDFEICFGGSCYFSVTDGQIIPQSPVAIQPGQIQGMFDHMWNKSTANPYIEVKMKFYTVDSFGNPTGEPFYVNYVYNENLGVNDLSSNVKSQVKNTVVRDYLALDLTEMSNINIYAMDGKLVKSLQANQGDTQLNLSNLNKGQYVVVVKTASGEVTSTKVMVK